MGTFKKTLKYCKPSKDIDEKLKTLEEGLKKTGVTDESDHMFLSEETDQDIVLSDWRKDFYTEEEVSEEIVEEIQEIDARLEEEKQRRIRYLRKVDTHIAKSNEEFDRLRDEILQSISEDVFSNLPSIEEKIDKVLYIYQNVQEGLLNEPPSSKNGDPLTPLDQNFVTLDQLQEHYKLFINRISQQLATIGGGGETQLKYLDDVVGIATDASSYDGKYLKYDHSTEKFVFETITIPASIPSQWETTSVGINTLSNVGVGTTDPTSALTVVGNVSITGFSTFTGSAYITGNLGINNSDPLRKLDIIGNATVKSNDPSPNYTLLIEGQGVGDRLAVLTSGNAGDGIEFNSLNVDGSSFYAPLSLKGTAVTIGSYDGVNLNQTIFTPDGSVTFPNSIQTVGLITALSGFSGNLIGNVTGDITGNVFGDVLGSITGNVNSTGIITTTALNVGTGGTIITTTSNGFVGLGSTNPSTKLYVDGNTNIIGVTSSFEFSGGGENLRNLSGTNIVSYASHSETSNSSSSISGVSTHRQVGIITGLFAINASDYFGNSVATSADGKTIVVGAQYDELSGSQSSSGVVYVFDRSGNSFNRVGILTGSLSSDPSDEFGNSVATSADGKTIVVGAYQDEITGSSGTGVVYVFDRVGLGSTSRFNQVGILTGSLAGNLFDQFGHAVAVSANGKTIVASTPYSLIPSPDASGSVYVFDRVGNTFNQVGILTGSLANNSNDFFGWSLATSADGKTIVVGARNDEGVGSQSSSGVVYVFDRVGVANTFVQVGILTGFYASNTDDYFGNSVATSADGRTIVVGSQYDETGSTSDTGVVYVFDRVGNTFNRVGILTGSYSSDTNDEFGISVSTSADGKTIVVGSRLDEVGATTDTGVVYIYKRQGNSFSQVGVLTSTYSVDSSDEFGRSVVVSADGKSVIVAAPNDEVGATNGTGVVYVYDEVDETYLYSGPTGNIGIGTSVPTSKLHVVGDTLITGITTVGLGSTSTPPSNSQLSFELISDTQLRIKVRGSDGVLRSADIALS